MQREVLDISEVRLSAHGSVLCTHVINMAGVRLNAKGPPLCIYSRCPLALPTQLETTKEWGRRTVRLWEIVAELVRAVASPPPHNPFELDFGTRQHVFIDCMRAIVTSPHPWPAGRPVFTSYDPPPPPP